MAGEFNVTVSHGWFTGETQALSFTTDEDYTAFASHLRYVLTRNDNERSAVFELGSDAIVVTPTTVTVSVPGESTAGLRGADTPRYRHFLRRADTGEVLSEGTVVLRQGPTG